MRRQSRLVRRDTRGAIGSAGSLRFRALACDYDGTLATAGGMAPTTVQTLRAVRRSGVRVVLVTGRNFDDLITVCPQIDCFNLVVAENGAVLYDPARQRVEDMAAPLPRAFHRALERADVPTTAGRVIIATVVPHDRFVLETIRRLRLNADIVFNKEAVMILPKGVSKATGLGVALKRLRVPWSRTIGMGDAENDHSFLGRVGYSVAVANAIPAVAAVADFVTSAPNGAGLQQVVQGPLRSVRKQSAGRGN